MQRTARNSDELQAIAAEFAATLSPRDSATVVTLAGELGAGKTTFTQAMARFFGISETVTSPTFVIEKVYALEGQRFERLVHIDAYRINGVHEMEVLGWHELQKDPKSLVVVEWPEKIAGIIPLQAIALKFDIEGEGRIITSTYGD